MSYTETDRLYWQSPRGKEVHRRYKRSLKGKATEKRYRNGKRGRAYRKKWFQSEICKRGQRAYYQKNRKRIILRVKLWKLRTKNKGKTPPLV